MRKSLWTVLLDYFTFMFFSSTEPETDNDTDQ